MAEFINYIRDLNIVTVLLRCVLAVLFGGLVGFQRGKHGRAAGLRTHILVCLGSVQAAMIGIYTNEYLGYASDPLRIGAQVISGIGFLGVGTILVRESSRITGLTTAAGLWTTSCIGLALGAGFYEASIIAVVIVIITFTLLGKVELLLNRNKKQEYVYVELNDACSVNSFIEFIYDNLECSSIQVTSPRTNTAGNIGISICVDVHKKESIQDVINRLQAFEQVIFAAKTI